MPQGWVCVGDRLDGEEFPLAKQLFRWNLCLVCKAVFAEFFLDIFCLCYWLQYSGISPKQLARGTRRNFLTTFRWMDGRVVRTEIENQSFVSKYPLHLKTMDSVHTPKRYTQTQSTPSSHNTPPKIKGPTKKTMETDNDGQRRPAAVAGVYNFY